MPRDTDMTPTSRPEADALLADQRDHDLAQHVFTVSAGMVGVCLTAIGILRLFTAQQQIQTLGDDLLAIDAVLFVATCWLAFWSFKTRNPRRRQLLRLWVDSLFLLALTGMGGICAVIAYALL